MNDKSSKTFNFVYQTTNLVNGKIYVGVHKTENLDDGYIGSGVNIRRAIRKYGKESFEREILQFFETYEDALSAESKMVNEDFLNRDDVYNIIGGGFGGLQTEQTKRRLSIGKTNAWKDKAKRARYMKSFRDVESRHKRSESAKTYISNHKDEFTRRIERINHDTIKIAKTAETHRGMKRTPETRKRMSEAKRKFIRKNGTAVFGAGSRYAKSPDGRLHRMKLIDSLPTDWKWCGGE